MRCRKCLRELGADEPVYAAIRQALQQHKEIDALRHGAGRVDHAPTREDLPRLMEEGAAAQPESVECVVVIAASRAGGAKLRLIGTRRNSKTIQIKWRAAPLDLFRPELPIGTATIRIFSGN